MSAQSLQLTGSELVGPHEDVRVTGKVTFGLPIEDTMEVDALKATARTKLKLTLKLLERMHALRGQGDWVRSTDNLGALYKTEARGLSGPSLRRKYSDYVASGGDWRTLIDNYIAPSVQPPEFIQYLQALADHNPRSMAAAFRKLRDVIWPSGQPVPGYGTWMEWYAREFPLATRPTRFPLAYPQGWTLRNLRRYAPPKSQRVIFQRGLGAAHSLLPTVKRNPSELRPLELIVIDDFELDVMCVFRGDQNHGPQLAYVAGLMAIDVATRKKLAWGIGPRLDREEPQKDGSVKKVRSYVNRLSVQGLLHQLIERHGLPDYQVTILCENAAARIAPELELSLSTLFDGRIKVQRTSMLSHKTLANGFLERGGTPWEKGWIESEFNYLWNELADAPGYKGSNERLNAPADLEEKARLTQLLIGQGVRKLNLPPETLALLRLPFLNPEELERWLGVVIARSELRTDHRLLGFDRVTEFRLTAGEAPRSFHELALLTPQQQQSVKIVERMESPAERWARLAAANPRMPVKAAALALLLLVPKEVTYRNNAVTITHEGAGYTFIDPNGECLSQLPDKTKLLGYFNPAAPAEMHLSTLDGQYAGTLTLLGGKRGGVSILDTEGLDLAREQRAKIINRDLQAIRARHQGEDSALAGMRAHNDALVAAHRASTLPPVAEAAPRSNSSAVHEGIPEPRESTASAPGASHLAEVISRRHESGIQARRADRLLRQAKNESENLLDSQDAAPAAAATFSSEDLL
jgi:hypothetical protein